MGNYETEEIGVKENLQDIIGVSDIYVPVSDVYESVKWYEKNLGCKLRKGDKLEPGMGMAIMVFTPEVTWRVPVLFLHQSDEEGGRLGFNWTLDGGKRHAVACLVTPRIQELFERFKKNGVNIIGEIRQTCGPNLLFSDPDGNLWEIWQP
ncbi:VOC family protein [Paenibacillus tarimensis]